MTKVELISDPRVYFEYLSSDSITVLDANLISDDVVEIHYEPDKNFVEPNTKINVVIAALRRLMRDWNCTTCWICYKSVCYIMMITDSVIFLSKPSESEPPTGNYLGDLTNELL